MFADCKDEAWREDLPGVVGEDEGKKFQVVVDLQQATHIVAYKPFERQFTLKDQLSSASAGAYQIRVTITSESNRSSIYVMTLLLKCDPELVTSRQNYEFIWDPFPPVPFIESIDRTGLLTIKFNSTMVPEAAFNRTNQSHPSRLLLSEASAVLGARVNESSNRNLTLINSGTIFFEDREWPSVEVRIWPEDQEPEHYCAGQHDFSWECIDYQRDALIMQLAFEEPRCISAGS